jgi:hypothetical protein
MKIKHAYKKIGASLDAKILLFILLYCIGCGKNGNIKILNAFGDAHTLTDLPYSLMKDSLVDRPVNAAVTKDFLIVIDGAVNPGLRLYQKKPFQYVRGVGRKGKGSGEYLHITSLDVYSYDDNIVGVYDAVQKKYELINLDTEHVILNQTIKTNEHAISVWYLDSVYVSTGYYSSDLVKVHDKNGNELTSKNVKNPYLSTTNVGENGRAWFGYSLLDRINGNVYFTPLYVNIAFVINLNSGKKTEVWGTQKEIILPKIGNDDGQYYVEDDKSFVGFVSWYGSTSQNGVILPFSGKKANDEARYLFTEFYYFQGSEAAKYTSDIPFNFIAFDEEHIYTYNTNTFTWTIFERKEVKGEKSII